MAIIKETKKVYFNGVNTLLIKGNTINDDALIIKQFPELFEIQVKEVKKEEKVVLSDEVKEEPKEELLIEEPVNELKVEVEEPKEEPKEEKEPKKEEVEEKVEEPKKTRRKRKSTTNS